MRSCPFAFEENESYAHRRSQFACWIESAAALGRGEGGAKECGRGGDGHRALSNNPAMRVFPVDLTEMTYEDYIDTYEASQALWNRVFEKHGYVLEGTSPSETQQPSPLEADGSSGRAADASFPADSRAEERIAEGGSKELHSEEVPLHEREEMPPLTGEAQEDGDAAEEQQDAGLSPTPTGEGVETTSVKGEVQDPALLGTVVKSEPTNT
ncbi:yt521-b-like family domain-containing protein [Cyclospora cayetanensis]|uniref:Yt521-b-like family domain-containing protein n=1 Tax=Cyclospora cayetanensis TaxID=88456 RepID=A0A1D3CT00_9EIME|nr:yt521-b-like family domain-containing protein [Cyclospora cayetanensis]